MRKIILDISISLDGFIEGSNGELDWIIYDEEMLRNANNFLAGIDTILYGHNAYEAVGHPSANPPRSMAEKAYYDTVARLPKYVFSHSLKRAGSSTRIINGGVRDTVEKLKQEQGKDIWLVGGAQIISTFASLGLIDAYQIAVHPVILGTGTPLFDDQVREQIKLKRITTRCFESGVVGLYYLPQK